MNLSSCIFNLATLMGFLYFLAFLSAFLSLGSAQFVREVELRELQSPESPTCTCITNDEVTSDKITKARRGVEQSEAPPAPRRGMNDLMMKPEHPTTL